MKFVRYTKRLPNPKGSVNLHSILYVVSFTLYIDVGISLCPLIPLYRSISHSNVPSVLHKMLNTYCSPLINDIILFSFSSELHISTLLSCCVSVNFLQPSSFVDCVSTPESTMCKSSRNPRSLLRNRFVPPVLMPSLASKTMLSAFWSIVVSIYSYAVLSDTLLEISACAT